MTRQDTPRRRLRSAGRIATIVARLGAVDLPAVLLLGIALLVGYGVLNRHVRGSSVAYINELAVLLACWLAFLGAAEGVRVRYHVAIDVLVKRMPPRVQNVVELLVGIATCVGLGILTYLGAEYAIESGARLQTLDISRRPLIAAMPVGFGLMTIYVFAQVVGSIRRIVRRSPENASPNAPATTEPDQGGSAL